jgi:hypothetical protein
MRWIRPPEVAFARRVQHRARAEEEQALHERVVERVVEHCDERQGRQRLHADAAEDDREPDAGEEDADVLDRRIGEQALHVGLHRREDHPVERGGEPERERHEPPPPHGLAEQVEGDPEHAVDRRLEHHAAHEGGYGRRRRRMCLGQPHVQRQEPGLGPEAEQRQAEGPGRPRRRQVCGAHRIEGELPCAALQHAEAEQDRHGAHVRDQQVQESGAADLRDAVLGGDEEVRRQRHGFPGHHESVRVVGQQHEAHAGEEQVVLQAEDARRRPLALAEIPGGEDRHA